MKILIAYDTSKASDNIVGMVTKSADVELIVDGSVMLDGDSISSDADLRVGDHVAYSGFVGDGDARRPMFGMSKIKSVSQVPLGHPDVRMEEAASFSGDAHARIVRSSAPSQFTPDEVAEHLQRRKVECGIDTVAFLSLDSKGMINQMDWYVDLDTQKLKRKSETFIYE